MSLNTTQATGPANSSLVNFTAHRLSVGTLHRGYDPANNLGYGIGRIVRSAFDHLFHAWHKMWVVEPTSEELALQKQSMIFRSGLRECFQRLNAALDDVRKSPHDPSRLEKTRLLAEHYALYLKFQETPELGALQHKALQPLEEKISQLIDPQIKNALRQLLPIVFQVKSPIEETPDAKDTGPFPLADSRIAKTKRAVQQTGAFPASFDLSILTGTNGFAVNGLAAGDYLGYSVSTAGDVNGDGLFDLLLGAPYSPNGIAYAIFGRNTSFVTPTPSPTLMSLSVSSTSFTMVAPTPTPSPIQTPSSINPVTIEVKIPANLNATFIPITADILLISNNTITVSLVDSQGYQIVFTSNYSAVPLAIPFSPLDIPGLSIALGNGSLSNPPVF